MRDASRRPGLSGPKAILIAEADKRGWNVEIVTDEGLSGKSLKRPGLQAALTRLDAGQADVLLAIRLDRVSRSVADFAGLLDRSNKRGWALTLLSPNIDTADPAGRFPVRLSSSTRDRF